MMDMTMKNISQMQKQIDRLAYLASLDTLLHTEESEIFVIMHEHQDIIGAVQCGIFHEAPARLHALIGALETAVTEHTQAQGEKS
jgi:DNA-binding GntR family transcriptional regulator